MTAGAVVLLDVGLTLAWGEPLSTLRGWMAQRQAGDDLAALERSFETKQRGRQPRPISRLAARQLEETPVGQPIGRLVIPAIDLNVVAVEGTDTETLKKGPGRYPETNFPGQGLTVAIAGHRTTYLAPFRRINELETGDELTLDMPYASFTYRFQSQRIVEPSQVGVVRDVGYERLVLTACHPLYSAAQRIVVFARLVTVDRNSGDRAPQGSSKEGARSPKPSPAIAGPSLGPALAGAGGVAVIAVVGVALALIAPGHGAAASTRRRRRH